MTGKGFAAVAFRLLGLVRADVYPISACVSIRGSLAAYLIFVTGFTVAAFALCGSLTGITRISAMADASNNSVVALLLVLVFAPAFMLACRQMHRLPRAPHSPRSPRLEKT